MTPTTPTITMRLDPESLAICSELMQRLGLSRTAIVKLALRHLADSEFVTRHPSVKPHKREDGR